jgi:3-hydroxyacyl-CoA dehydrogenase/enoyl-CoA hydratase/3-hydroxybutyryl-CoA epimerase
VEPLAGLLPGIEVGIRHKTRGWLPAPEAIFACMVQGLSADMESALKIESRHLAQLMIGNHARTLVNTYFFDLRAVKRGVARPACDVHFTPQRIGVLGANTLGTSLALLQASQGFPTVLHDSSLDHAELSRRNVALLTQDQVNQGRMSAQSQMAILERVVPTNYLPALGSCNVVIAAEPDTNAWRSSVRRELPKAERVLATCTEGVAAYAGAADHPSQSLEDPVGLHFFLPVEASPIVEIVRRASTSATAVACAFDHTIAMGKMPLLVADRPGYFVGRVVASYCREGAIMLAEGIPGQPIEIAGWQIGMALGPLGVMDDLTLPDCLRLMRLTARALPCPGELLLEQMITTYARPGLPGCGFYELPVEPDRRKKLWPELTSLFVNLNTQWEFNDVKDRLLYRQSVEAARCIAEGVVGTAAEVNIGSVYGAGFPDWTGGALQFIYAMGIEPFRQRTDALAAQFGEGFLLADDVLAALHRRQPQY